MPIWFTGDGDVKGTTRRFWVLVLAGVSLLLLAGCSWDYVAPNRVLHENPSPVFSWSSEEGLDIDLEGERQYRLRQFE
jgi:hypothetical protein